MEHRPKRAPRAVIYWSFDPADLEPTNDLEADFEASRLNAR
jgi:hypothetical protein